MHIVTVRTETHLEGLPYVGIVIDDQNIRFTHFATYFVPGKLERELKKIPTRLFGIFKLHFMAGKLYLNRFRFGNALLALGSK